MAGKGALIVKDMSLQECIYCVDGAAIRVCRTDQCFQAYILLPVQCQVRCAFDILRA